MDREYFCLEDVQITTMLGGKEVIMYNFIVGKDKVKEIRLYEGGIVEVVKTDTSEVFLNPRGRGTVLKSL